MKVLCCITVVLSLMQFARADEPSGTSTIDNACVRYPTGEKPEYGPGKFGLCLDDNEGTTWCREWECPEINCAHQIKEREDSCPRCRGTCEDGGQIYPANGKSFTSVDGQNSCFCAENGMVGCSKLPTNIYFMCKIQSPEVEEPY